MSTLKCIAFTMAAVCLSPLGEAQTTTVKPVLTRDQDNGDRAQIFSERISISSVDIKTKEECLLTPVPAGKRLVVESISGRILLPRGQAGRSSFNTQYVDFVTYLPLISQGEMDGMQSFVTAVQGKFRFSAGQTPCVVLTRDPSTGSAAGIYMIRGYLIDAP